jgi:hypothetical protein
MISTRNHALKKKGSLEVTSVNRSDALRLRQNKKIEQIFEKKVSLCPPQLLRYAYGGVPLWVSNQYEGQASSPPSPSRCPGCHELRVFEMQLMPTALVYLENLNSHSIDDPTKPQAEVSVDSTLKSLSGQCVIPLTSCSHDLSLSLPSSRD